MDHAARCAFGLLRLDGEGVEAGGELRGQRLVDQAVLRQTGESGKLLCTYADRIMRLALRPGAGVPMVQVRFVHYLQLIG